MNKKPLIVNFFGGPGSGKSTMTTAVFSELKFRGINCEIASEYAKDLVYENREKTFKDQIYIFGKQHNRIFRLIGEVDIILCDSPLLLTPIYDAEKRPELEKLAIDEHKKHPSYNVFIKRCKKFNPNGRVHNEEQSIDLDKKISDYLDKINIPYQLFEGTSKKVQVIADIAIEQLNKAK